MSDRLTLTETLGKEEKLSTFSKLLETTGAGEWLTLDEQFTVFAPTNDAFEKIPKAKLDELLNEPNQATLKLLLSYHFMPGKIHSDDLITNSPRKAITGGEITFTDSDGLQANGANVQSTNLQASNGVIHQVDTVLAPAMKTAVKRTGALEAAKTKSAAPAKQAQDVPAIGSGTRKTSTIF
ncbi:MAG TPA: fasciclin domain-containing protein [Pyrinomonadaceae bacterium]